MLYVEQIGGCKGSIPLHRTRVAQMEIVEILSLFFIALHV